MNILPLTYLGNIEYFDLLCRQDCIIDLGEHYIKQTYRNRCDIMSANGVMSLSVNLKKPATAKAAMRDMRLDFSKRWQHQHWLSIVSAYKGSAYFEHFEHLFAPFYHKPYEFLCDYNLELTSLIKSLLGYGSELKTSLDYLSLAEDDCDFRAHFSPKLSPSTYKCAEYYQVFGHKFSFAPNLSIIDMLFCENSLLK